MTCHTKGCDRPVPNTVITLAKPFAEGWRPVCEVCFEEWMNSTPRATGKGRHVTDLLTERKTIIED